MPQSSHTIEHDGYSGDENQGYWLKNRGRWSGIKSSRAKNNYHVQIMNQRNTLKYDKKTNQEGFTIKAQNYKNIPLMLSHHQYPIDVTAGWTYINKGEGSIYAQYFGNPNKKNIKNQRIKANMKPRRQLTTSNKKRKYDSNRHSAEHKFKNSFYTHQPIFHPPASVSQKKHMGNRLKNRRSKVSQHTNRNLRSLAPEVLSSKGLAEQKDTSDKFKTASEVIMSTPKSFRSKNNFDSPAVGADLENIADKSEKMGISSSGIIKRRVFHKVRHYETAVPVYHNPNELVNAQKTRQGEIRDVDSSPDSLVTDEGIEAKHFKTVNRDQMTRQLMNKVSIRLIPQADDKLRLAKIRVKPNMHNIEKDETGILNNMIDDVAKINEFRNIQSRVYKAKEYISDYEQQIQQLVEQSSSPDKNNTAKMNDFKQQIEFVHQCKEMKALPLPLLKYIKFNSLVLDNYQINHEIAAAFGKSIHFLDSEIKSITLSNNNIEDVDIACILNGALESPIESITIKNNKMGSKSIEAISKFLGKVRRNRKGFKKIISLKHLEINHCEIEPQVFKVLFENLQSNREIESLSIISMFLDKYTSKLLSEFVLQNYILDKL